MASSLGMARLTGLVLVLLMAAPQCDTTPSDPVLSAPSAHRTTDAKPVEDAAPYWCRLTPKAALARITGLAAELSEYPEGWRAEQGGCLVRDGSHTGPLGVSWSEKDGRGTVLRQVAKYRNHERSWLPEEIGYGFIVYTPGHTRDRPYYAIVNFQCGDMKPWLSLGVSKVRDGRDYQKDLTALMRIAEKRFGVLHGCEPGPVKSG